MDVHRSIGAVTPEALAEGSSSAAEALHKSLVAIRKELAKKNKVIEDMKREMEGLSKANEKKQQPKFEDLFEPTVEEEEEMGEELCPGRPKLKRPSPGNSRRASAGAVVSEDFDQILLFEDAQRIREREEATVEQTMVVENLDDHRGASPVSDLIMAFVASEEEDDEDENPEAEVEVNEEDDGRTIELIPNQDILIHKPQSSPRPIIRTTLSSSALLSSSPRSESGSQTDITALRDSTQQRGRNGPVPPKWSSEPKLSSSRQVTFRVPAVSQVIASGGDSGGGGRYSILNRDFTPKVKDKPSSISANGFIRQKKDEKGTKSHVNIPGKTLEIPGGHVPDGYLSSSSGESADELIEEAESFLAAVREGKEALVSVEEWSVKRDRKVQSRHRHHRPRVLPFVPHTSRDLRVGNVIRGIHNERLVSGVVRKLHGVNDLVDVAIEGERQILLSIENTVACVQ